MRWFRFYDDAINDPKILKLPEATRWHWTALLCIASKHDGVLPPTEDVALMLRVKTAAAAAIIATLKSAGLLDLVDGRFSPHNWNGRQYKSDVSTERVKRFRNGKRNVSSDVSPPLLKRPQSTETETEQKEDRIGDAGASQFTEGSKALTVALWKAVGIESALQVPPELAGTDWRAIEWERAGWTVDLIDAEARRIGPGKPLNYYEKCFATSFAKRQAPLPVVEVREADKLTVTKNAHPQSRIIQAADDLRRKIASFDGPARGPDELRSGEGAPAPRLLSNG